MFESYYRVVIRKNLESMFQIISPSSYRKFIAKMKCRKFTLLHFYQMQVFLLKFLYCRVVFQHNFLGDYFADIQIYKTFVKLFICHPMTVIDY